jgi:hypothetical protein
VWVFQNTDLTVTVLKYWEEVLGAEVQEVNCSICLVLEVKDVLNNDTDGRVQGRVTQMTQKKHICTHPPQFSSVWVHLVHWHHLVCTVCVPKSRWFTRCGNNTHNSTDFPVMTNYFILPHDSLPVLIVFLTGHTFSKKDLPIFSVSWVTLDKDRTHHTQCVYFIYQSFRTVPYWLPWYDNKQLSDWLRN